MEYGIDYRRFRELAELLQPLADYGHLHTESYVQSLNSSKELHDMVMLYSILESSPTYSATYITIKSLVEDYREALKLLIRRRQLDNTIRTVISPLGEIDCDDIMERVDDVFVLHMACILLSRYEYNEDIRQGISSNSFKDVMRAMNALVETAEGNLELLDF